MATSRQEWKSLLHLTFDVLAAPAEQRAKAPIEAELLVMEADKVEHGANRFSMRTTQTASKLLEEERRTLGRPEQE